MLLVNIRQQIAFLQNVFICYSRVVSFQQEMAYYQIAYFVSCCGQFTPVFSIDTFAGLL